MLTERAHVDSDQFQIQADRVVENSSVSHGVEEPALAQPDSASQNWNDDADRFNRFFRKTPRPAAVADVHAEASAPFVETSPEQRLADEHSEVADSVAEYMEKLLQRSRGERTECGIVGEPRRKPPTSVHRDLEVPGERVPEALPAAATQLNDPAPSQQPRAVAPRLRQDVNKIRAGVGSLREVANLSARAAVANHTSRKLRRTFTFTVPLTITAFILAAVTYLRGGSEGRFNYPAFNMAMLGVIATLELVRSWVTIKHARTNRNQTAVKTELEGAAADTSTEDRDQQTSAGERLGDVDLDCRCVNQP